MVINNLLDAANLLRMYIYIYSVLSSHTLVFRTVQHTQHVFVGYLLLFIPETLSIDKIIV